MSTALYRRYRPETFAEVIGQDHVTGPLMQALRTGRVTHAYLFSGPRGCGKTTSARILARTLNCARNTPEAPTDVPCGECPSCVELARGGPGSLDVVEIDAASHGGVDDARDLRERATFAPTRDRYKIFIIDEAHMVSSAGFNALLKIVEEPPPHIKFVFATTEPDKVIGTIRSRTHHYPFRLVPPDVLGPYLEELCSVEGVTIGSGVVPLVTRAGGGSVRDSLSVMDQLIAGAEGTAVDYERAVALLGFTNSALLDDVVDALAARDGASIFRVVDHVIASGHEPRRFVEDLLERLRDLVVIAVSGDAADAVLRDVPADQLTRMRAQASNLGLADLSRAADLTNAALTEMAGATSPRLHLELLCARLLLPGADDGAAGFAARLDRLERGGLAQATGGPSSRPSSPAATEAPAPPSAVDDVPPLGAGASGLTGAAAARAAIQAGRNAARASEAPAVPAPVEASSSAGAAAVPPAVAPRAEPPLPGEAATPQDPAPLVAQDPVPVPPGASVPASVGVSLTTEDVRHRWDEILGNLERSRVAWSLVKYNAQVAELRGDVLVLVFPSEGLAHRFSEPRHIEATQDAVYQTIGAQVRVEARTGPVDPGASASPAPSDVPGHATPSTPPPPVSAPPVSAPVVEPDRADDPEPPVDGAAGRATPPGPASGGGVAPALADDADEAWLAGRPIPGAAGPDAVGGDAPPDPAPARDETVSERQAPPVTGGTAVPPVRGPVRVEPPRETPRQAAERRAAERRVVAPPAPVEPDPYDEPSDDDPDLASAGLVGVPLVVQTLGGTIIEERIDSGG